MAQQKQKKGSPWVECDKCFTEIINKDIEKHSIDCPPSASPSYGFIKDQILTGFLDTKTNEEVNAVVEKNSLVFLSQSAIQLCGLAIGDWAIVKFKKQIPIAKVVWPTAEKSLTSILLTKKALQLCEAELNQIVQVSQIPEIIQEAYRVDIVLKNVSKSFEITPEFCGRIQKQYNEKLIFLGNVFEVMFFGKRILFEIRAITVSPDQQIQDKLENLNLNEDLVYRTTSKTLWKIYSDTTKYENKESQTENISRIGGLENEITEIQEAITSCLTISQNLHGINHSNSILLYGHSGTGKTSIARLIPKELKVHSIEICASDLYSKYSENVERAIKTLFDEAIEHAPSIILLDEVDILCPIRSARMTDSEKRVVSTLLTALDSLNHNLKKKVFILGTTNKLDGIDPAFRRYGRFDREIEIPTPNPKSRKDIISKLLSNVQHSLSEDEIHEIALNTHGFVGADLLSLCSRASSFANRNNCEKITLNHVKTALKYVRPSAMREVQVEVANVRWSDIGGQENLKMILKQAVEWPLRHPESFLRLGVTPPKGVLMFGPPGCSKTMIAKALATESGLNFLSIKGPELFSKWVGESEKAVREVFRKARQVAPSIIFFDEIDAVGGERSSGSSTSVQERVLAQLLTELDGVSPLGDVTILAATNRPDRIDKALLRPGRLDRIVYVPLPDSNTRREIFRIKLSKMPVSNVDIEELVRLTEKYSGAEVNAVCHEAAMMALEENLNIEFVEKRHFDKALELIVPRTPDSLLELYQNYVHNKNV